MSKSFENFLKKENLSQNTIASYLYTTKDFFKKYDAINKENLLLYKEQLIEESNPKTVNLRIHALNKYLHFIKRPQLCLKSVRVQQVTSLDRMISNSDYLFFISRLKKEKNLQWYFAVRLMTATGARISELIQFKGENIIAGNIDIYGKGGKTRRLYIPDKLRTELLRWIIVSNRESGYIFLNRNGRRITTRGISIQLKRLAVKNGLEPSIIHPHAFRHLFAKNFIDKINDVSLLADLMGHESIETTRIYLRRTGCEQRKLINKIVTW